MKWASVASTAVHVAFLAWMLISFSSKPFEVTPAESLPVDLVKVEDFQKMAKGAKDSLKLEEPKPMVEKQAAPKPVEETKPKVTEKKEEIKETSASPPPAPEKQPDKIAEELKKLEEPKPDAKLQPKPTPPKKPPQPPQQKFDADKIAALLDKRAPQRNAATDELPPNQAPTLGGNTGSDKRVTQSELDALRARLRQCWSPPVGADNNSKLYVVLRVMFKKDGTVLREPVLVEGTASNFGPAIAESAKRAVLRCQPFTMLRQETYDIWKDVEIKFDLQEMLGG